MITPPLKWAGGKRWLVRRHPELFDIPRARYIEPFLGSGAVYFFLAPEASIIGDKNTELMNFYACIRDDPDRMIKLMSVHAANHSKLYYYSVRSSSSNSRFDRAARFLYLNRTCWNGLYRENKRGEFNVPIGTKTAVLYEGEDFSSISELLAKSELSSGDYAGILEMAGLGDFVFVDPPYTVKHNSNGFIKYNEQIFSWNDQERLAEQVIAAADRGANIMVTNAAHESVLDLYRGWAEIFLLKRHSILAGKSNARVQADEALMLLGDGFSDAARSLRGEIVDLFDAQGDAA